MSLMVFMFQWLVEQTRPFFTASWHFKLRCDVVTFAYWTNSEVSGNISIISRKNFIDVDENWGGGMPKG